MTPARYPCDLHCHTTRSDGNDSPRELIDNAASVGLAVLGITDHDTLPPETIAVDAAELPVAEYARQRGVQLVPGYEFSCDTWVDDVHICGYRLDGHNPAVVAEVQAAEQSKSRAYEELCERLTARGLAIEWERDILSYVQPDGTPARRLPDHVQRKHIFEAMAAKGYTATWSEAKILVQGDPGLNVRRRKIDPIAAIELIHACGGIAILAHPYLIEETVQLQNGATLSRAAYIDRLIAAKLDGMEASYTYDKTSYKGAMTPEEIEAEVRRLYAGRLRIISGGSDYHADHKKGAECRALGERGISLEACRSAFGAT